MIRHLLVVECFSLTCLCSPCAAQNEDGGFWAAAELGYAFVVTRGGFPSGDGRWEGASAVMLGGTVSDHLRIGGELAAIGAVFESVYNLDAVALYAPWQGAPLYVRGGVGIAGDDRGHVGLGSGIGVGTIIPRTWFINHLSLTWFTQALEPGVRNSVMLAIGSTMF